MKDFSFVAIDFETANESRLSACSLGLAVFDNGTLTESRHWYLCPAVEGEFNNTWVHGIKKEDCVNQATIKDLWFELEGYFHNRLIVAHNANFDMLVLNDHLKHFNLGRSFTNFACTLSLAKSHFLNLKNYKLSTLCNLFGVEYGNHDAELDAISCGHVFQKLLVAHQNPYSIANMAIPEDAMKIPQARKRFPGASKQANMDGIIVDEVSCDATLDFFYDKKCVVTGLFNIFEKHEITQIIEENGGKVQTSVAGNTSIVVVGGEPGWAKIDKVRLMQQQGINVVVLDEKELIRVIAKLKSLKP